ncbi:MAG TPA: DNA primase [Nitrospiria bacterium]|jgi:DNA primase|nr:DNA primase [Nitrospiria bacterium]
MERGYFSEDLVPRIKQESDILEWVSRYVSLKKTGQNWVGLCPFHSEKTPSFTVSPGKQVYHCFGCGVGGDVISFLMKMDGSTFPETIKVLAERLGISIHQQRGAEADRAEKLREELFQIHRDAADYYHAALLSHPEAQQARDYLRGRGILKETIDAFSLGFAPPGWNGLQQFLTKKGWSPEPIEKAGLIIAKTQPASSRKHYYDRFRERVIFPIFDLQNRVTGFGGRVLDGSLPKYLNSPETPIFSKGRQLYAMDKAREAAGKFGHLVVVEGYFDAIAAHQAGIHSVVATLGTALTADHLERIHRFVQTVKLIFDPDEAGIRAALRTVDLIIPSSVAGEVVLLPNGEDPDSFIKNQGAAAFNRLMSQSMKLLDFAIRQGLADPAARTIEGKLRIVDRILPAIRKVKRAVERSYYVKHLAESLGLDERELTREVAQLGPINIPGALSSSASSLPLLPQEEQILIHLLVHNRVTAPMLLQQIDQDHFTDGRLRQIFNQCVESSRSRGEAVRLDTPIRSERADPQLDSILSALMVKEPDYDDSHQTLKDCIRTLRVKKIRTAMKSLESEIRDAERSGDNPQVKSLLDKLVGLKKISLDVNG